MAFSIVGFFCYDPFMAEKEFGSQIGLDGGNWVGKSTQLNLLTTALIKKFGPDNIVTTQVLGGTELSQELRKLMLSQRFGDQTPDLAVWLASASMFSVTREVVYPARTAGKHVLTDRTHLSMEAFQAIVGGANRSLLTGLEHWSMGSVRPNLVVILDVPVEIAIIRRAIDITDSFELKEKTFHEAVRKAYIELSQVYPGSVRLINGVGSIQEVHLRILSTLNDFFTWNLKAV